MSQRLGSARSSEDFHSVTAFQVGEYGRKSMKTLPNIIFDEIDSFVYAPNAPKYATELLHSSFDGDKFAILARARMSAFARKCASDGTSPRPCERESLRTRARLIRHGGMEEERASSHLPSDVGFVQSSSSPFPVATARVRGDRKLCSPDSSVNFARRDCRRLYQGKLSWCSKFELMDSFLKICTEYTETLILSAIHSDSCGHKPNCGETCQHSCTPHSCLWRRLHRRLLSGAVPMTLHLLPRSAALPLLLLRRVSQGTACAPRPRPRPRR